MKWCPVFSWVLEIQTQALGLAGIFLPIYSRSDVFMKWDLFPNTSSALGERDNWMIENHTQPSTPKDRIIYMYEILKKIF